MAQPVETTEIGHPLLAVPAEWERFGLGDDLVRIQLSAGRITRTDVPVQLSSGPVYLVVGPDRTIVRPLDTVTGYEVVDGQPVVALSGALDQGGPALPGRDRNHLWMPSDAHETMMQLVGFDGTPTGVSTPTPDTFATADHTGVLDSTTAQVRDLGVQLPAIHQLALRVGAAVRSP